jgi:hypothetical protein
MAAEFQITNIPICHQQIMPLDGTMNYFPKFNRFCLEVVALDVKRVLK